MSLAVLIVGCGDTPTGIEDIEDLPRELSLAEFDLLTATNRFAFRLLDEVYEAEEGGFVFLSPLSASMALGMTMNGADGETWDGMRGALSFEDLTQEEINESYRSLIDLLRDLDPNVTFGLGNSLWYREGFQIETPFVDTLREYFDAEVEALDFNDPGAVGTINAWVHESTDGMIEDIVDPPIDPLTMAFLINAIYFDGTWTYTFDREDTRPGLFTRADGSTEGVSLMELTETLPYTETDALQVVDLPYGGRAFSMTILLPKDEGALSSIVADLDAGAWDQILGQLHEQEITVKLPRFELEYGVRLNDPLIALGMADAFDWSRADFSRMYRYALEYGLHIKEVKHKTFVEVDEAGTRAAAATSVEMAFRSAPAAMVVDHPFLFVLRERFSGAILFVGAVGSFSAE